DPDLVREGGYRPHPTTSAARELLDRSDRPTAVFAANDLSAVRVLEVARDLGIRVPDELSIVGYDNIPDSVATSPQLTTVAQPLQEMGRQALGMLVAALDGTLATQHVR